MLQSSLCFLVKRFGKVAAKPLKNIILDFYDVEELDAAKQQLLSDVNHMNLGISLPHIPGRREGDSKAVRIVDDIFTLLTFLDENLKLNSLPCYVTDNPDAIPSGRLYEGDLAALMKFMRKVESEVKELKLALAAMTNVYNQAETQVKGRYQSTADQASVINKPAKSADAQLLSADLMNECRPLPQRVWGDEFATDSSSCVETDPNDWQPVGRHRSKRRRVRSDQNSNAIGSLPQNLMVDVVPDDHSLDVASVPVQSSTSAYSQSSQGQYDVAANSAAASASVSRPSYTAVVQSQPQRVNARQQQQQQTQRRKQVSAIVGRSRNSGMPRAGNSSHIVAAKPYIGKATFCIDNVSTDVSELTMAQFVAAMDIDVLGCYNVKPRRSSFQRSHGIEPKDRKAFRLCIPREDTARLMDPKKWPAHISVSHWIFKRNSTQNLTQFEDARVQALATSDVHQADDHSVSSRDRGSNAADYTTANTSPAHRTRANGTPTHQSTPSGAELLPPGADMDMDDTIITDNNDQ